MANKGAKIVFGGAGFGLEGYFAEPKLIEEVLNLLEEDGVRIIDSACSYGKSEETLGEFGAPSRFIIDTKFAGGLVPNDATIEAVVSSGKSSLEKLKTTSVDVYYIHFPDRNHPLQPILAGINELHKSGMFKRFGLSNFTAEEVDEVIRVAKEKNYVLPSVYQGLYSPIARRAETELFPTLRKHGIAFYAYSPSSGGFLNKTRADFETEGKGRWDPSTFLGQLHNALYKKDAMLDALDQWVKIAEEAGVSKVELAYRWVTYNSSMKRELGDAIIFGARTIEQLKETLAGLKKGPLSKEVQAKIDNIWKVAEKDSPLNNIDGVTALAQKGNTRDA